MFRDSSLRKEGEVKMDLIKLKRLFLFVVLALMMNLFSVEASAEKRIGVLLFSEEERYIESKNGIMDQLKKDGFGEPAVKYTIANAGGSKAKAAKLAQEFAAAKMDLIITSGTNATIAATKEIKDVPIVFSQVYDPIEAGIAKEWKSSGNNTTGVSTGIPVSNIMDSLKEFPQVKRVAVLYTPGEKQTEIQVKELQKIQASSQIQFIPVPLTNKEEVAQILPAVVQTADAIYLTGSSIVGTSVSIIVDIATKAKVVTITRTEELVDKGVLLGICANAYPLGIQTGKKAVKILRGTKPSSIPIEVAKKVGIILNRKTAKAGEFQIPSSIMKRVTKTIE
jgi:putative ABC transport system substrate-binding protein